MFDLKKLDMKKNAFDVIEKLDLSGKVYIITGAYSGLGAISTKVLLKAKAKVILAGRNNELKSKFVNSLLNDSSLNISNDQIDASLTLDLADLKSVKYFAEYVYNNYDRIDVLMNNAGVMNTPAGRTKDGFEIQMGVNVIGHFLLAKKLVPITKRQVWLAHDEKDILRSYSDEILANKDTLRVELENIMVFDKNEYDGMYRYKQSKLGNILLAKQFPLEHKHLLACSVFPGIVQTNLGRHASIFNKIDNLINVLFSQDDIFIEPELGASTQLYCSTIKDSEFTNGAYYSNCKVCEESESSKNMLEAKRLYDYCDEVTKRFQ